MPNPTETSLSPVPEARVDAPYAAPSVVVEAARYALLRRLSPVMRHELVVPLQPIGMIIDVVDRRLQALAPDIARVRESIGKLQGLARAAVDSCLDVITWISPDASTPSTAGETVAEMARLLRSHFSFRGIALHDRSAEADEALRARPFDCAALRSAIASSLLALVDEHKPPIDVTITIEAAGSHGEVCVRLRATPGHEANAFIDQNTYRPLTWPEVAALAEADGVGFEQRHGEVRLHFRAA